MYDCAWSTRRSLIALHSEGLPVHLQRGLVVMDLAERVSGRPQGIDETWVSLGAKRDCLERPELLAQQLVPCRASRCDSPSQFVAPFPHELRVLGDLCCRRQYGWRWLCAASRVPRIGKEKWRAVLRSSCGSRASNVKYFFGNFFRGKIRNGSHRSINARLGQRPSAHRALPLRALLSYSEASFAPFVTRQLGD